MKQAQFLAGFIAGVLMATASWGTASRWRRAIWRRSSTVWAGGTRASWCARTAAVLREQIGEVPESDSVWWVATPDHDVYPEEVAEGTGPHLRVTQDGEVMGPSRRSAGFST